MNLGDCMCDSTESHLERVRYFSRQLLDAHDLTDDQTYHRAKQRLHNRMLHGWGIVCGLDVHLNPTTQAPLNVTIRPGFALSPQGDEICVPDEVQFDLATCTTGPEKGCCSSPCSPILASRVNPAYPFWIAIRYAQCPSRPVRVPPLGCGCDDTACEYSRIRDSFEVACLDKLPDSYHSTKTDSTEDDKPNIGQRIDDQRSIEQWNNLMSTKKVPCPPCPDNPWVVLAKVTVQTTNLKVPIIFDIDDRRIVLSVALIQEHVRLQCK